MKKLLLILLLTLFLSGCSNELELKQLDNDAIKDTNNTQLLIAQNNNSTLLSIESIKSQKQLEMEQEKTKQVELQEDTKRIKNSNDFEIEKQYLIFYNVTMSNFQDLLFFGIVFIIIGIIITILLLKR